MIPESEYARATADGKAAGVDAVNPFPRESILSAYWDAGRNQAGAAQLRAQWDAECDARRRAEFWSNVRGMAPRVVFEIAYFGAIGGLIAFLLSLRY